MREEPVLVAGAIVALIEAAIVMTVAMGWLNLDGTQQAAIMMFVVALVAVVAPPLGALWARTKVRPITKDDDPTQ